MLMVVTVIAYFVLLFILSAIASKQDTNETFFLGQRRSSWPMVAFGMIGASISGVTLISVPGMVIHSDMSYLQTCLGFIVGYFVVAFVLLPVFYRLNVISIYSYLNVRFGRYSYLTGAWFFLISKLIGASVRFYVICFLLQEQVLNNLNVPFSVTVFVMVSLIWLYTKRGGIRTLVITDVLQTLCLFITMSLITVFVARELNLNFVETMHVVMSNEHSNVFIFNDFMSSHNFLKQFIGGIFIVIVMTGLDQDMMQKHLTCKNLSSAKKDMCTYGFAFLPANLLFLSLGVLLLVLAHRDGIAIPSSPDSLLPMFVASNRLGPVVIVLFTLGVVAACFSSADSALTALTTSFCIDILKRFDDIRLRRVVHLCLCGVFILFILLFRALNSASVIDAIYVLCSYTYGPLLGLFAFGLLTHRTVYDRFVPYIALLSPLFCFVIDTISRSMGYHFGYELLLLNGMITFLGLYVSGFFVVRSVVK